MCGAALDGSMIVIACGIFLTIFHAMGGSLPTGKPMILIMAAAALLIAMFYGFVWVCAGGPTPGMRAVKAEVGQFRWLSSPTPGRAGSAIWAHASDIAPAAWACCGPCWMKKAFAWHDHISKTFPTFHAPETSFVRRR